MKNFFSCFQFFCMLIACELMNTAIADTTPLPEAFSNIPEILKNNGPISVFVDSDPEKGIFTMEDIL